MDESLRGNLEGVAQEMGREWQGTSHPDSLVSQGSGAWLLKAEMTLREQFPASTLMVM